MLKKASVLYALSLVLLGCGQGENMFTSCGSTDCSDKTTSGQAQGAYFGAASNGYSFLSIVLPDDKFYGIYGTVTGALLNVYGMMTGQGKSSSGTFTASVTDFLNTGAINNASVTASYMPGSSINGTIAENGTMTTFTGAWPPTSSFDFNIPASVSSISGSWSGSLLDGMSTTVTINSNGAISGKSAGCQFTGTAIADSSGKNFFDVSLTFGGSPCAAPNKTASGVGVDYLRSDGVTLQLLVAVTADASFGTVFFAQR